MNPAADPVATLDDDALIEGCERASLELLTRNLTPHGILAASRIEAAVARRDTRIFGRDAAICVMALCGSGMPALEQGAATATWRRRAGPRRWRAPAAPLHAPRPARFGAGPELRELRDGRPRRRRVRQRAGGVVRARRRGRGAPHRQDDHGGARVRAVPDSRGPAPAVAPARAVAALHGAAPAEPGLSAPQRRHLAVRRRLLGDGAGAARPACAGTGRTVEACAHQRAGWLALHQWFHDRTLVPMGMAGQSWNAAAWLLARRALPR